MKTYFFFLLSLIGLQTLYAQSVNTAEVTSNSNYTRMSSVYVVSGANENVDRSENVKGSPYLYEGYKFGAILKNDEVVVQNVALKYNVYNDLFKGKMNLNVSEDQAQIIIKSKDYKIKLGDELFVVGKGESYYQVIHSGAKYSLLKKHSKVYYESVQATTSLTRDSPARYKDKLAYYLVDAKGNYSDFPTSKKKVIKLLANQQDQIKGFIKKNKIDVSDDNDLKRLFEYYETL